MANLVKKGDIIRLKKGSTVKVTVPEKFSNNNKPFSEEKITVAVTIGEVLKSNPFPTRKIEKILQEFCLNELGADVSRKQVASFVSNLRVDYKAKEFDTSVFEGEYVVIEARRLNIKIYPHYVKCRKKDDSSVVVEFYQDCPAVKCNIDEIEVVGHI